MATIFNLVTELSADPSPMAAGFAQGTRLINSFLANANAALTKQPRSSTGRYAAYGVESATSFVASMQAGLAAKQGVLLEAFARGALNPEQFKRLGVEAEVAFNHSLIAGLDGVDLKKAIPPEARQVIVSALRETGLTAAHALSDPFKTIGSTLRSFGRDLTQAGRELSIALTAPIVAGAAAVLISADTIGKALDEIAVATGATGVRLAGLDTSFSALFTTLPNSANDVAKALTVISQISGATGSTLEGLARQALNLSRITGTDLTESVTQSQRAFQAWGVSVASQAGNLDTLFKISQQTGSTIGDITSTLTRFAPAMRQFGLSFTQSAALIGQFQKNGIDADSVFTALQTSLSKFAGAGLTGAQGLSLLITKLKEASSDSAAINIASNIFGPRQAAQLALAVRSGKINIDALTASVRASGNTIDGAAAKFDPFNASLGVLRNKATDAGHAIGETLEGAFTRLQPTLVAILGVVQSAAESFTRLPRPLQDAVIGFTGLVAVAGPLLLIIAGLTKTVAAFSLAIGIVNNAIKALTFVQIGAEAFAAATGVEAATGAVGAFATGLAALATVGVVVGVIAAIYLAFEHFTKSASDAKDALDDFTKNVAVLNGKQLNIQTSTLRNQLLDVNRQITELQAKIDGEVGAHQTLGVGVLSGQVDQLDALKASAGTLGDKLNVLATAQDKMSAATYTSTTQLTEFNTAVDKLITSSNKHVTVDAGGVVHGSIKALTDDLAFLQEQEQRSIRLGKPNTAQFEQAIQNVTTALVKAQTVGKSLPDVLDPALTRLEEHMTGLASAATQFADPLRNLGKVSLNDTLIKSFIDLNAQVDGLGARTDKNAQKIRELAKSAGANLAASLGADVEHLGAFKVAVTGEITKIVPASSLDASNNFIDLVKNGIQGIENDATKAAVATQALNDAYATGNVAAINTALAASKRYYAAVSSDQAALSRAIDNSNVSLSQQKAAHALIGSTVGRTGADTALSVQLTARDQDVKSFMETLQKDIDAIPGLDIPIATKIDLLALHDQATDVAKTIASAQLQALAGNVNASAGITQAVTNGFVQKVQAEASKASVQSLDEQSVAFKNIAADAALAGISVDQLKAAIAAATKGNKIIALAEAFASLATNIFGAQSALSNLASGFSKAFIAAVKLKDTIKEIQAANAAPGGKGGSGISGLFNSVQNVIKVVPVIGQAISAGIDLLKSIGGLFGKSALDKEHDAILRSNNDALNSLRDSLDRNAGTPGQISKITQAIAAVLANPSIARKGIGTLGGLNIDQKSFTDYLHSLGLTFSAVNAQAKALGITLFDSKGINIGVSAFMKALGEDATLLTTIGKDLASSQTLIKVRNALNGTANTPEQALKDSVDAIAATLDVAGGTLGKSLQDALGQGPEALRAALKVLVAEISSPGGFPVDQLSQLGGLSASDLLSAIGGTADDLNALGTAASSAASSMLNVPAGFKRALAEFNATTGQAGPTVPTNATPPMPPTTGAPGHEPLTPITNGISALIETLKGLFTPTAGSPGLSTNPVAGSATAPSALSSLSTELTKLTHASTTSGTALSDVLQTLAVKLPAATDSAGVSLAQLIKDLASATVTAPAPTVTVAPLAPISVPAPTFHVEAAPTVSIAAPPLSVQAFAPITIAAPTLTVGAMMLAPPTVTVGPFAPIVLEPPEVTFALPAGITLPSPTITIPAPQPVRLDAPRFSVVQTTQTLTVPAPTVRVAGDLAAVVVQPPPVTVDAYRASVSLSPPKVAVRALANVHLAAPPVTIAPPRPQVLAAPTVRVSRLSTVTLARPRVVVAPFEPVTLPAPKLNVLPVTQRGPFGRTPPDATSPVSGNVPFGFSRGDSTAIAKALGQLAATGTTSSQPAVAQSTAGALGDIHLHGTTINVDARDKTAAELFTSIKKEAQKIAAQKTGNSTNVLTAFQA